MQEGWWARLARNRSPGLLFRLADGLFETPILTIPQARCFLEISYPSAKATVEKLKTAGILEQAGESSAGKIYAAPDILKIIT